MSSEHLNVDGEGRPADEGAETQSRRGFLRAGASWVAGLTALGAALKPLKDLDPEDVPSIEEFLRQHYLELDAEERAALCRRIEAQIAERWQGFEARVSDPAPLDGVDFVYALNLSRCIGCRRCVHACVAENNASRSSEIQYIRVIEMPRATLDLEQGDHHYDHAQVPDPEHFYMPVQCHQCAKAPCTKVCPVEATWTEPDGITVVDYDWCIGCRYCEVACPYWARRFNFAKPEIEAQDLNPEMALLSNRPRATGVVEKCTYCLHRTREGRMPACLEVCPVGARKFGNVLDPESEVAQILRTQRIFVLKEDVGTLPRFFYYFDERYPSADSGVQDEGGDR